MGNTIFEEEQRFDQWWLWLLLIAVFGIMTFSFVINFENTREFILAISISYLFLLVAILFIWRLKLKSRVDEIGIHINYWPFYLKTKLFAWNEIQKVEVIKYSPIADYGGWGYRINLMGKGKALNVKGNIGLKIYFKNGKKLLIGTQKREELNAILAQYQDKLQA